jgi:predicted Zn-dependent protease
MKIATVATRSFARTLIRIAALSGVGLLLGGPLGGCASDSNVRSLAARTNGEIMKHPEKMVRSGEVQSYVSGLASMVLEGARQHRTIDAKDPQKDEWVYDKFDAVVVLDKSVNAFVTGDDVVYVHSGLIRELDHPDQLVAVLTHELGHNELRHLKNNIDAKSRQQGLAVLAIGAGIVGGNWGRGIAIGAGGGGLVNGYFLNQFNRKEELAADASGLDLYLKMGYDPAQFSRVFEILKAKYGEGKGGTHPTQSERIKQVGELAAKHQGTPVKTLDVAEFNRIRQLVIEEERWAPQEPLSANPKLRSNLMSCFSYICTSGDCAGSEK